MLIIWKSECGIWELSYNTYNNPTYLKHLKFLQDNLKTHSELFIMSEQTPLQNNQQGDLFHFK